MARSEILAESTCVYFFVAGNPHGPLSTAQLISFISRKLYFLLEITTVLLPSAFRQSRTFCVT
jgi:hypothetical protein